MAIKVKGRIALSSNYEVELDMTEEEFNALSERQRFDKINDVVNWETWLDESDIDDVDVYKIKTD